MQAVWQTNKASETRAASRLDTWMLGGLVVFLAVLPFHLVVKSLIPGPLGSYWKEILLGLLAQKIP